MAAVNERTACWMDLWYACRIKWAEGSAHVDFELFEVVSDGDSGPELSEPIIEGTLKWDGCCHLKRLGEPDTYLHLCGREDAEKFTKALMRVWDETKGFLGKLGKTWEL